MKKGLADNLSDGSIMRQYFTAAFNLLDQMAKTNRAWHTREAEVAVGGPFSSSISKAQMLKDQEKDENIAKMMIQMDLLTKHVMGNGSKSVNALALSGSKSYEDDKFDALYYEEVLFLLN